MRLQQLEGLVIAAMDRARSGRPIEDDRIEFKREWPEPRARQLAGLSNRANGNEVIYIVGADENGRIHPLAPIDPADWWAKVASKFDGICPDLIHHINVPIGDSESVVAMQFATDRAPYVVKVEGGGSPEMEVPMRDGTRTRSARRDELLRMLVPEATVPSAILLECGMSAETYLTVTTISARASIFLEHTALSGVMLPLHEMNATLESGGTFINLEVSLWPVFDKDMVHSLGVHRREDGVMATAPGTFICQLSARITAIDKGIFRDDRKWKLRLRFGVTGSSRPVRLEGLLKRSPDTELVKGTAFRELGRWELIARDSLGG